MNKYEARFSDDAADDYLKSIEYISSALGNPKAAKELIDDVDKVSERLSSFPESSPLCADEKLAKEGVRFALAGSYILFYIVIEEAHAVVYVGFFHSLTNYVGRLLNRL